MAILAFNKNTKTENEVKASLSDDSIMVFFDGTRYEMYLTPFEALKLAADLKACARSYNEKLLATIESA